MDDGSMFMYREALFYKYFSLAQYQHEPMPLFRSTIHFPPTHLADHWALPGIELWKGFAMFTCGCPLRKVVDLIKPNPYFSFTMEKQAPSMHCKVWMLTSDLVQFFANCERLTAWNGWTGTWIDKYRHRQHSDRQASMYSPWSHCVRPAKLRCVCASVFFTTEVKCWYLSPCLMIQHSLLLGNRYLLFIHWNAVILFWERLVSFISRTAQCPQCRESKVIGFSYLVKAKNWNTQIPPAPYECVLRQNERPRNYFWKTNEFQDSIWNIGYSGEILQNWHTSAWHFPATKVC